MKSRIAVAVALVAALSGCSIFRGKSGRPKTAVLGERIPVLTAENDASVEASLADVPVTVPAPEANAAWAQPGGNAAKSFGNPALGASISRVWSVKIPKSTPRQRYGGGPVIAAGRVYVMDAQAVVHAFDLKDGHRLWETAIATGKKDRGAFFGGGVSFDDGKLYATDGLGDAATLDAATGKLGWHVRPGGPLRGAPTIAGGNVYVESQDNQIFALRQDTGETLWTASATLVTAGVFGVAAPAVAQGTVVAGFSSGELSALRYENGRVVWQDQLSRTSISTAVASISDIDASPVVDQGKVYAIGQGGRMVAMDLIGGNRLWEINVAGIDTPWLVGDWLFVVTDDAKLLCIQRTSGKIRWLTQFDAWTSKSHNTPIEWSGPVLAGGRLYLLNGRGQMVSVNPADGKAADPVKAGKIFSHAPVVADNMMVLLDDSGALSAWR